MLDLLAPIRHLIFHRHFFDFWIDFLKQNISLFVPTSWKGTHIDLLCIYSVHTLILFHAYYNVWLLTGMGTNIQFDPECFLNVCARCDEDSHPSLVSEKA